MTGPDPAVAVLADDLSGAAEAASVFLGRHPAPTLHLAPGTLGRGSVDVVDLNTRALTPPETQRAVRTAVAGIPTGALLLTKIDSLLRGQIGAWTDVLDERGPVIVVAALPALARTVRHGILHVGGVPLHQTRAWRAETALPPASVAELFGDRPVTTVPLGAALRDLLAEAAEVGRIAVCDAVTDADLDEVLAASRTIPDAQLVGTSALAAAVARTLPTGSPDAAGRRPSAVLLTVVGTAEPVAALQVGELVDAGARSLTVGADRLLNGDADPADLARELDRGSVVLTIGGHVRPATSSALSAALARYVSAGQADRRPDLVLTGGATARAVVDAVGLTTLRPVHQVHHGAVVSVASDGRTVVTRPGSFGDATSLVAIANYLAEIPYVHPQPKALT